MASDVSLYVTFMSYCSKCGEKLPEDANFCFKCGVRTTKGAEAGVSTPLEELREAFSRMEQEMEKAFSVAAKEMEKAFKTARENIQRSIRKELVVCPHCGEKNSSDANFCYRCGKKLKA